MVLWYNLNKKFLNILLCFPYKTMGSGNQHENTLFHSWRLTHILTLLTSELPNSFSFQFLKSKIILMLLLRASPVIFLPSPEWKCVSINSNQTVKVNVIRKFEILWRLEFLKLAVRVFSLNFLMGGLFFFCPLRSPSWTKSNGGGGDLQKFPAEAKISP